MRFGRLGKKNVVTPDTLGPRIDVFRTSDDETNVVERLGAVRVTTVEQLGRLDPTTSTGITPQALDRLCVKHGYRWRRAPARTVTNC